MKDYGPVLNDAAEENTIANEPAPGSSGCGAWLVVHGAGRSFLKCEDSPSERVDSVEGSHVVNLHKGEEHRSSAQRIQEHFEAACYL